MTLKLLNQRLTAGIALASFAFATAASAQDAVINEIMFDPFDGSTTFDSNNDGNLDNSEDEFVEIVNTTSSNLDISGWTISDSVQVRHTFAASTILPPNGAIIVFGGGTPVGPFGDAQFVTASTGLLGFGSTDTVTLADDLAAQVDFVDYTSLPVGTDGDGESIVRDEDVTGTTFVDHSEAATSGGDIASAGTQIGGANFGEAAFLLQVLHASDLEGGTDAIDDAPNFAAIVEYLETNAGSADGTIVLSAGDNYIPGPFFTASSDFSLEGPLELAYEFLFFGGADQLGSEIETRNGAIDITIMNIIGFDASALGNHEFDLGSETLRDLLEEEFDADDFVPNNSIIPLEIEWPGANFPYLSANLDFSGDVDLAGIVTSSIFTQDAFDYDPSVGDSYDPVNDIGANEFPISQGNSTKIAPAVLLEVGGDVIGVVGATTQRLNQISSPSGTVVIGATDNDIPLLATQLQAVIDQVLLGEDGLPSTGDEVNKVVIVSHLQQFELEQQLATLLTGVDVIVAGGSDKLLNNGKRLRSGDTATGAYPTIATSASGEPVLLVSTDGEYSYVGQLNVPFDANGLVSLTAFDESINGPVATDDQGVEDLWGDLISPFAAGTKGEQVQNLVAPVTAIVTAQDGNIFGYSAVFLEGRREFVRTQETNLGNLSADANLWRAQQDDPSVVISFKNGGGIRDKIGDIDSEGNLLPTEANPNATPAKPEGAISELDIANVFRFNNSLVTFDLSGQDILEVLEHAVEASFEGTTQGRFPQISGLQFSFTPPVDNNGDGEFDDGTDTAAVIENFALTDLNGNITQVLYQDGAFVGTAATDEFTIVTLNFLATFGNFGTPGATAGDGYPFPGLGQNLVFLQESGNDVGEQLAMQQYLAAMFPTPELAYSEDERDIMSDPRVQNLSFRKDTVGVPFPVVPAGGVRLTPLSTYDSTVFDGAAAEIAAFHAGSARVFVTSADTQTVRVLSIDATGNITDTGNSIAAPAADFEANSVDTFSGPLGDVVAICWSDENASNLAGVGRVTLHDPSTLAQLGSDIIVGHLPDMLTFTPDGTKLVVANEGEDKDDINPEGSVSVIVFGASYAVAPTVQTVDFTRWNRREDVLRARGVLLSQIDEGLADNVAEDLEPEYVAVTADGNFAYVGLQENNAVALIDLQRYVVRNILPLGVVDHSQQPADFSDRDLDGNDGVIQITTEPVFGLPQPDAIAVVEFNGSNYLLTANEGDARDFEELPFKDVGDLGKTTYTFDSGFVVGNLQDDEELGRLEFNLNASDPDNDGDIDSIVTFGGRNMHVYTAPVIGRFRKVASTDAELETATASFQSMFFNANNDENDSFESRSDAKGVEPEALLIAEINGDKYAFIGMERQGAIAIYNVTDPRFPSFVNYVSNRNFVDEDGMLIAVGLDGSGDPEDNPDDVVTSNPAAGDLGPESFEFVPAADSPTGGDLLIVPNEVSGTVTVYSVTQGL